jgi:hypothetical protein
MNARYAPLIIGLLIGVALGLFYGWVIHPIEHDVTTPNSLQEKYQAELILMIAEAYSNEPDLDLARQRMIGLGYQAFEDRVENALNFAQAHDFSDQDVQTLTNLLKQLSTPIPSPETDAP